MWRHCFTKLRIVRHHAVNWIAAKMEATRRVAGIVALHLDAAFPIACMEASPTFIVFFSSSESSSETLFAILLIHHDANWIAAKMEATRRVVSLTRVVRYVFGDIRWRVISKHRLHYSYGIKSVPVRILTPFFWMCSIQLIHRPTSTNVY